ncbi:MAG: hypothetical protein ACT4PI_09775 [Actinomycetota bacterium]
MHSGITSADAPAGDDLFDYVYGQPTSLLRVQQELLHDDLART